MRTAQARRRSVHVRTFAARFGDQQNAGGHVPGIQAKFPKGIQPPAGYIGQIQRRGSGAPHAMRDHGELIVEMHVDVLMPLAAGESGGDECVVDVRTRET